ncbi:MAG: hypothetical protein K6B75_03985, partial [Lachnospiraceae bacterium]|nr:hypothetical protein [Lachnospiraceae bacterium]
MKFKHLFKQTEAGDSYRIFRSGENTIRLDFFSHILRVAILRDGEDLLPTYTVCPDFFDGTPPMPRTGRDKISTEG